MSRECCKPRAAGLLLSGWSDHLEGMHATSNIMSLKQQQDFELNANTAVRYRALQRLNYPPIFVRTSLTLLQRSLVQSTL